MIQKNMNALIAAVVALVLGGVILMQAAFIVYPHEQILVLQFGDPQRVIKEPGLFWKIPFVQEIKTYDKRVLALDIPAEEVIAADKNRLVVDTYTRYKISDPLLFYQKATNEEKAAKLLAAIISPDLRKILGRVSFSDLLSQKREQIMANVKAEVIRSSQVLGVEIVDVRIRKADVPKQNSEAIYKRMNSERERFAKELRAKGQERAQNIRATADKEATVVLAEAKRDGEIERGTGDAKAAEIYAGAFGQDKEFFKFFRSLKAYRKALSEEEKTTFVIDPKSHPFFETMVK